MPFPIMAVSALDVSAPWAVLPHQYLALVGVFVAACVLYKVHLHACLRNGPTPADPPASLRRTRTFPTSKESQRFLAQSQ